MLTSAVTGCETSRPMAISARTLLVATAAFAIVACGSSSSSGTSGSGSPSPSPSPSEAHIASVDACSLVTQAEASAAAGAALTNFTASLPQQIPGICIYAQQGGAGAGVIVYAQVYADTATADQVTAAEFSAAMQAQIGQGATSAKEVTGIGDKAYEFTDNGSGGAGIVIIVFKANVVFMIAVDPSNAPGTVEGLAKTAIGRLNA